jgi:hypothetical protein
VLIEVRKLVERMAAQAAKTAKPGLANSRGRGFCCD